MEELCQPEGMEDRDLHEQKASNTNDRVDNGFLRPNAGGN
jgi:hypothetical protein